MGRSRSRPEPLAVAVLQLRVEDGSWEANAGRAMAAAKEAVRAGARLLLLPELWSTGYAHAGWAGFADGAASTLARELADFCESHGVYLGGSMVERAGSGGLVNRFRLFGPDGAVVMEYDKAHLFAPLKEDVHLVAGDRRVRGDVCGWTAHPSICYDLRFPEMYRLEAVAGADLFLVVSAWPAARGAIMRGLAWARAVENQAFLVLCNRTGPAADGEMFAGGSMVVAPDGTVLAEAAASEITLHARLDPAELDLRARLPVLANRVPGVDAL